MQSVSKSQTRKNWRKFIYIFLKISGITIANFTQKIPQLFINTTKWNKNSMEQHRTI